MISQPPSGNMLLRESDEHYYTQLPSGLIVPQDCAPRRRPTCVDLFCGCGGMSLGVIQAGMEVVAAVDWDCPSAHTYMTNLGSYPINIHGIDDEDYDRFADYLQRQFNRQKPEENGLLSYHTSGSGWISHHPEAAPVRHFFIGDVRKLTGRRILEAVGMGPGEIDCVCGGPPCQGFSPANMNRGPMDPRNSLVFEFIRLVLELQPKTMIMENVPEMAKMLTPWGTTVIDEIALRLQAGGWATAEGVKKMLIGDTKARAAIRQPAKPKSATKKKDPQESLPWEGR